VNDFDLSYGPIIGNVPGFRKAERSIQNLRILRPISRIRIENVCATALLFVSLCFVPGQSAFAQQVPAVPQVKPASSRTNGRSDVKRFHARVDAALAEGHAQKAFWGILVVDRDTGQIIYELNADHFFTPASNAKIFTSSLAFATLGPSFQFRSTLESVGQLGTDGNLAGDMVFVGRGDPDISNRKFPYAGKVEREGPTEKVLQRMVDDAIAKGLKQIEGDIIADDSYYPYDPYPPGWSIGDLFFTFGAPISAVTFNDNCISVEIQPAEMVGEPAIVVVEPAAASETFAHDIKTISADGRPEIGVARQPGPNFLLVRGTIPAGHAPIKLDLAMPDPAETLAEALKQIFQSRGVAVTGTVRVRHAPAPEIYPDAPEVVGPAPAPLSPTAIVFAEHISPPLSEIVRVTNKVSQNLYAELLLRAVGHEKKRFGVTDAGLWVEQDFLKSVGVADGDVVLTDGSGLSRDDLVTPRSVVQLLSYDAHQPWGADYISTFPIAGVDGTLENRFKNTRATGEILAKTGALERVHGMSGFATTNGGEQLIFAVFGNNNPQRGRDSTAAIDAIATAMIETIGPQAPRRLPRKNKSRPD
jgi:D-alanyl-D-alanine carboxypeptidase/D-alanyl-D-alanine-endopeptidase (penicillin-binding protein 4)